MKKLLLILGFWLIELMASATTYYVATDGNDTSGDGSANNEWLTLQKAADSYAAGDIIIVRNGTYAYTDAVQCILSTTGTSGSPVIFRAENKWGAVLDGQESGDGSTGGQYSFIFSNVNYITIKDFEIKNFRNIALHRGSGTVNTHITIEGCKIHDIGRYETSVPNGICGIFVGLQNTYWNITKNMIYNIGRTGPSDYYMNKDHSIYLDGTETRANAPNHNSMTYNLIYLCSGVAITSGSDDDLIANNVIAWSNYNGQGGSAMLGIDEEVINLTIANNIMLLDANDESFAIWTAPAPTYTGWSIKNNMVYGARMNCYSTAGTIAAMDGGNYGETDCENGAVDPLLVSATRGSTPYDFTLQAGSPAINAGVDVGLTTDYAGNGIIGLPDVGAIEVQGEEPEPEPDGPTKAMNYHGKTWMYHGKAGKH